LKDVQSHFRACAAVAAAARKRRVERQRDQGEGRYRQTQRWHRRGRRWYCASPLSTVPFRARGGTKR